MAITIPIFMQPATSASAAMTLPRTAKKSPSNLLHRRTPLMRHARIVAAIQIWPGVVEAAVGRNWVVPLFPVLWLIGG